MPRIDLPSLSRPIADVLIERDARIEPQRSIPDLVEPPEHPVLTPSSEPLQPVIHQRIRTLENYWHGGWRNAVPACLVRGEIMDKLARVADSLPNRWGLAVFDAWRPLELQTELYESVKSDPAVPPDLFARPNHDPTRPPPHLTGGAVDLTLTVDGVALSLGCGFDDPTEAAHARYLESEPGVAREGRRFLYHHMHDAGFVVFRNEWWHFEYGTMRWSEITGQPAIYGPASPTPSQLPSAT